MKRFQRLLAAALIVGVLMALTAFPSAAAKELTDISGHWAESYVKSAVARGYVNGYEDGTFKPNNPITRSEFCKLINSALGLTATTSISFSDVTAGKWYYAEAQKAVAAGYISGYDNGTFGGENRITRQEAAVIISRLVPIPGTLGDITRMKDSASISSWAMNGAKIVFTKGYINGDDQQRFRPLGDLTRGEAVKIIETMLQKETVVNSNLTVTATGQTFSDRIYTGSVVLAPGLGSGTATFSNCRILGPMVVNGGGASGVRLSNTTVASMTVNNANGSTGIAAAGSTSVGSVLLSTPAALVENSLTGAGFTNVTVGGATASKNVTLTGDFDTVTLSAPASLNLTAGSIKELNVGASAANSNVTLASGTNVSTANVAAASRFQGAGKIAKAVQTAKDVTYETQPASLSGSGVPATPVVKPAALTVACDPANNAKDQAVDKAIKLTFSSPIRNSSDKAVTAAYIRDSAVSLLSGGSLGTKVAFDVTISADAKTVTLTPMANLKNGTAYSVVVHAGTIKNTEGAFCDGTTFTFTTVAAKKTVGPAVTSIKPSDGAKNVSVGTEITLTFDDTLMTATGKTLTASYVRSDVIELHRGSKTGSTVAFTATVGSTKKAISIEPTSDLKTDTKYYVVVLADTLLDSDDDLNEEQWFSFTTSSDEGVVPEADPESGSEIDTDTKFVFTFPSAMYNSEGSTLTASYLQKTAFTIRQGSQTGSKISFSAKISSDRTTVTLTPDDLLAEETDYYVILAAGSLLDEDDEEVPKLVFEYTTDEYSGSTSSGSLTPTSVSPKNGKTGVDKGTDITLTFGTALYNSNGGTLNAGHVEDAVTIHKGSSTGAKVAYNASVSSSKKVITLTPLMDLTKDTKYYVTIDQGAFRNDKGTKNAKYSFSFTVGKNGVGELEPYDTTPSDGANNVSATSDIRVYFSEPIYQPDGSAVTASYLKNSVFEIRKNSASGTRISFSASINSAKKTVTLTPNSELSAGATYYVILLEESIANSDEEMNEEYTFSFSVSGGGSTSARPTSVSPKDGATNVSTATQVVLSFDGEVFRNSSRAAMTPSAVVSSVEIRKGSNSSSATKVGFSANVALDGSSVSLKMSQALDPSTTYYIYIPGNTFFNGSGTGNSAVSYSFTTGGASSLDAPEMTPADKSRDVSSSVDEIRLSFNQSGLTTAAGASLTSDYIAQSVTLTADGEKVPFTASYGGKTVVLIPNDGLLYDTEYKVSAAAGVFKAGGASSKAFSYSFSTAKPTMSVTAKGEKTTGSLTVTYDYSGANDASFLIVCGSEVLADNFMPKTAKGSFTREIEDLEEATEYRVTVTLTYNDGKTLTDTATFTTGKTSHDSTLDTLTVTDLSGSYGARLGSISGGQADAEIIGELEPDGGSLTITASPNDENAVVVIDGTRGETRKVTVPAGKTDMTVKVVVTAEDDTSTTYILTIHLKEAETTER